MNHVLLNGTGAPNGKEYFHPAHVTAALITDITYWCHHH